MPNQNQRPPVTLEQLLQLKRAERPDPEFWSHFEAELRQKQLAALVQRRSWWRGLPQLFSPRAYLPIGATAVLAFTLVSVRYYAPTTVAGTEDLGVGRERVAPAPVVSAPSTARDSQLPDASNEFVETPMVDDRTAVAAQPLSENLPEGPGAIVPWDTPAPVAESPSARAVAANLARLEQTDPELVNYLRGGPLSNTSRAQDLMAHPMEMAAVAAVTSRSRRLLAQFDDRVFTPDPAAPEVFRERISRRLGDTELAGGWKRVDMKSDRVSLKF